MREVVVAQLDQLEVPDCDIRRVTLALAEIVENPDRPTHTAIATAAIAPLLKWLRIAYEPRTPLHELLDAERAERIIVHMRDSGEVPAATPPVPPWK